MRVRLWMIFVVLMLLGAEGWAAPPSASPEAQAPNIAALRAAAVTAQAAFDQAQKNINIAHENLGARKQELTTLQQELSGLSVTDAATLPRRQELTAQIEAANRIVSEGPALLARLQGEVDIKHDELVQVGQAIIAAEGKRAAAGAPDGTAAPGADPGGRTAAGARGRPKPSTFQDNIGKMKELRASITRIEGDIQAAKKDPTQKKENIEKLEELLKIKQGQLVHHQGELERKAARGEETAHVAGLMAERAHFRFLGETYARVRGVSLPPHYRDYPEALGVEPRDGLPEEAGLITDSLVDLQVSPEFYFTDYALDERETARELTHGLHAVRLLSGNARDIVDAERRANDLTRSIGRLDDSTLTGKVNDVVTAAENKVDMEQINQLLGMSSDEISNFAAKHPGEFHDIVSAVGERQGTAWDRDTIALYTQGIGEGNSVDRWWNRDKIRGLARGLRAAAATIDVETKTEEANASFNQSVAEALDATNGAIEERRTRAKEESGTDQVAARDPRDRAHLNLIDQIGADITDPAVQQAYRDAGCDPDHINDEACGRLRDQINAERDGARSAYRARKANGDPDQIVADTRDIVAAKLAPKEEKEEPFSCKHPYWAAAGSGALTAGKFVAWDLPKFGVWTVPKFLLWDAPKAAAGPFMAIGEGLMRHGKVVKQGLFSILSALAQYNYTKKGSDNSETQLYRGIAMALGISMGVSGQLPEGMQDLVDPLEPFKREPMTTQLLLDEQNQFLTTALTMGGDPDQKGGFPYGTHEQLQAVLEGSIPGTASIPNLYDPNYYNFTAHAYNGFVPEVTPGGAYLDPNFGTGNNFRRGSGSATLTSQSVNPSRGVQALEDVLSATRVQRDGVRDFANRLDRIDVPDNSLASLVDYAGSRNSRANSLRDRADGMRSLIANGASDPNYVRDLRIRRDNQVSGLLNQINELDRQIPALIVQARLAHTMVTRDEDGLERTMGHDWSNYMRELNDTLNKIREITMARAKAIEGLSIVKQDPEFFDELMANVPKPAPTPPTSFLERFFIRVVHADIADVKLVPDWKAKAEKKLKEVEGELLQTQKEILSKLPQLKELVKLDPDGVHEINMEVVQVEKFNMKGISRQMKENLEKLSKAEETLNSNAKASPEEKEKLTTHIKNYRAVVEKLMKETEECALELSRVEELQTEKVKRYKKFVHEKEMAQDILTSLAF